jgi:hypothetical protein
MSVRPEETTPIIIGGSHRSGTTLLRRLLNGHPRIFCPAEIKFHKDLLGQFPEDPLAHGRLGSSISALGLPTEVWLDEFGRAFVRCIDMAARLHGKARWADKNPENALNIAQWERLLGGRLHFVLVVRHPFDIVASMQEIKMNRVLPATLEGRAEHVVHYIESGLRYCAAHPERSSIVKYELLVSDHQLALERLLSHLGERYDAAMLANLGSDGPGRGPEDPKSLGRSMISSANIERWRKDFAPDEVSRLQTKLSDLLVRLGYDTARFLGSETHTA